MSERYLFPVILGVLALGVLIWLGDWLLDRLVTRRIPLQERERGWLALAAPYFRINGFRAGDLDGLRLIRRHLLVGVLRRDWEIVDTETALARLDDLLQSGHRADPTLRDPSQSAEDRATVDRALLAWDAMRTIFVARCCFAVGYFNAKATWAYVQAGVRLAAAGTRSGPCTSWEQWGSAFLVGRMLWSRGRFDNAPFERLVERLLGDRKSEWNRFSWPDALRTDD